MFLIQFGKFPFTQIKIYCDRKATCRSLSVCCRNYPNKITYSRDCGKDTGSQMDGRVYHSALLVELRTETPSSCLFCLPTCLCHGILHTDLWNFLPTGNWGDVAANHENKPRALDLVLLHKLYVFIVYVVDSGVLNMKTTTPPQMENKKLLSLRTTTDFLSDQ